MSTIRVGFIGCGGNASGHVGRILAMGECEVVGLCDVSETSIARVRERHREQYPHIADVPVFADYREMLDKVEMDAVEISTAPYFALRADHGGARQGAARAD